MTTTFQLTFLEPENIQPPNPDQPFDLHSYDHYLVAFSGGKDSIATFLHLLDNGVPLDKIELWHHEIDGREGSTLIDWPCTAAYCKAFAEAFGVPIYFSWRTGGFEREMLRDNAATAPVVFELANGSFAQAGGDSGKTGTRLRFPQQSASLSTRWCSAYLKVDVMAAAIRNQARFNGKRTLVLTGERAEESACRAGYDTLAPYRADARESKRLKRWIDHHRPIKEMSETEVWASLERYRINPHPAYRLGWGRVSCAGCIFGSVDQWASLREVNPHQFVQIAEYEARFGCTISRNKQTVIELADRGTSYAAINSVDVAAALRTTWDEPIIVPTNQEWKLPAGAFGDSAGPI
jgi:3'-phosphoadenosine 5'-phosphosulfate sulfotransferase (PAPS reductase)/FAD synthetase